MRTSGKAFRVLSPAPQVLLGWRGGPAVPGAALNEEQVLEKGFETN